MGEKWTPKMMKFEEKKKLRVPYLGNPGGLGDREVPDRARGLAVVRDAAGEPQLLLAPVGELVVVERAGGKPGAWRKGHPGPPRAVAHPQVIVGTVLARAAVKEHPVAAAAAWGHGGRAQHYTTSQNQIASTNAASDVNNGGSGTKSDYKRQPGSIRCEQQRSTGRTRVAVVAYSAEKRASNGQPPRSKVAPCDYVHHRSPRNPRLPPRETHDYRRL